MADQTSDIEKYRKGELTASEMHALEKKALDDPFLFEALEGVEFVGSREMEADIDELNKKINQHHHSRWIWPLGIAASISIIVVITLLIYNQGDERETLAIKKDPNPVPQNSSPVKSKPDAPDKSKQESKAGVPIKSQSLSGPVAKKQEESDKREVENNAEEIAAVTILQSNDVTSQPQRFADTVLIDKIDSKILEQARKEAIQKLTYKSLKPGSAAGIVSTQLEISGKVTTKEDGLPLPGVNIRLKGSTEGTVTDFQGNYTLPVHSDKAIVQFSFIGMESKDVQVNIDKPNVDVQLNEDAAQLSEVIVTGSSEIQDSEEPVVRMAFPIGGIKAYNNYLESSLQYPQTALDLKIKGKVVVGFVVKGNGELDEFTVIKRLGYGCDEEVIRLIKDGPRWNPTTENDLAVDSNVRVRLKFDPAKAKK